MEKRNSISNSGENLAQMKVESETEGADNKPGEYVRELLQEKQSLDASRWPNALRLLDQEVTKEVALVQTGGKSVSKESKYVDIYKEKPIRVSIKVLVPVKEHPKFNFVGKLLGPKGNSMKRLQEETMTKMAVLGRGSMKDKQKEEELRASLDPKYAHLSDELHVEIVAFAPPAEAHARIAFALAELRKYLVPDLNDGIRQEQMREMELMAPEEGNNGVMGGTRMPGVRGGVRGRIGIRGASRGGRGLLSAPPTTPTGFGTGRSGPPVRNPGLLPPQSLMPRPGGGKTKVLSILDRARVAMEESYGYDEDIAASSGGGFYDSSSYNASGYGGYNEFDESSGGFFNSGGETYADNSGSHWKSFKTPSGPSSGVVGGGPLITTAGARFRPAPYTRPSK